MDYEQLLSDEKNVRQRAKRVLELTNIQEDLKKFGEAHLIGSYKYKVMMMRDVDFHVIVPELNSSLANHFFKYVTSKGLYDYVYFRDKHLFNARVADRYPTKKALDSYSFGLRLELEKEEWQLGINFITEHQEASNEIIGLFQNASNHQRAQILAFKHLIINDLKAKVSSAYIYRAVIEEKIADKSGLLNYLKTKGYSF